MSLYLAPSGLTQSRLDSVAREISRPLDTVRTKAGAPGYVWVGRDPARFAPAKDPVTGVIAVCSGRLCTNSLQWQAAERLPFEGGLANRLVLKRYLDGGIDAVAPYDGAAIIAVLDPRTSQCHVWVDQLGYHPCFVYRRDSIDDLIVTTFPDALLADPGADVSFDLVSMAEFMRAWRTTPPHTYFREVHHAGAASRLTIDTRARTVTSSTYWRPFQDGFFANIDEAAEALASAIRNSIRERTSIAKRPLTFLSGGADSRTLLFSAADPHRMIGANIFEVETNEVRIAKQLCEASGATFLPLQRDIDYYPRTMRESVRWSGAMWSAEDCHYTGFASQLEALGVDLVLTACSADWVFKSDALDRNYLKLFGRNLPHFRYSSQRLVGWENEPLPSPPEFAAEIDHRMSSWFDGCASTLSSPLDRLIAADRRIRPMCYSEAVSGQLMYRLYPYDTFFADRRMADCYSRLHPDWRLNREVWGKAVARVCVGGEHIVHANYGWRVDAGKVERAAVFGRKWLRRRFVRLASPPASS